MSIRDEIATTELLSVLEIDVPKSGFIRCPAHRDRRPSLKVYQGTDGWYCYQCRKGGGPVEFLALYRSCPEKEAITELLSMFGKTKKPIKRKAYSNSKLLLPILLAAWDSRLSVSCLKEALKGGAYRYWVDSLVPQVEAVVEEVIETGVTSTLSAWAESIRMDLRRFTFWMMEEYGGQENHEEDTEEAEVHHAGTDGRVLSPH